jgi:SulP family sulfate permease
LLLVAVVYAGSGLVADIPLAALAGVLMVTAARMVDVHNVRSIVRATRSDALILAVTCAVTVAFDLIVAVEVGMAVAAVLALRHLARTSVASAEPVAPLDEQSVRALRHEHIVVYRLDGALFFGAVQRFFNELTAVDDVRVVILRLPELQMLDATGAQALVDVIDELERRHITVLLKGPRPHHRRILEEVGALARLAHQKHLFDDLDDAIAHARDHAQRPRPPAHHPPGSSPTISPADRVVATTGSRRSQS